MNLPSASQKGQGILEVVVTIALVSIIVIALVALGTQANRNSNIATNEQKAKDIAAQMMEILNSMKQSNTGGVIVNHCVATVPPASPNFDGCAFGYSPDDGQTFVDLYRYDWEDSPSGTNSTFVFANLGHRARLITSIDSYYDSAHSDNSLFYVGSPGVDSVPNTNCLETVGWCLDFTSDVEAPRYLSNIRFSTEVFIADSPGVSKCNLNVSDYIKIKQFTARVSWNDASGSHNTTSVACISKD